MAGRVLGGRYTVQDRIGTGGMAVVYRGLDEVLGRTVAIKIMLPQYATDPSFAARFKQEAQAAGALNSAYIVSVYDWGKDGDTYYIVMEYLRGTDLKSGIRKRGALDNRKVAQIGSQVALALSEAHRHEIIHRDIKPQNIMVLRDGNIKVMDFGIARAKNSHLTTDNSVLGTAHYVSPEQTQGKELGPTTDIYSLGIVMYETATGKVPFEGDDAITVALKQVNEQPKPPSQINPNVDPYLEAIILKCMQKDPAARFQTADELYHVLRDYMAGRFGDVEKRTQVIPHIPNLDNNAVSVIPANPNETVQRKPVTTPPRRPGGSVRQRTAAELAREKAEKERRRKRKRRVLLFFGLLALTAVVGTAVSMFLSNANAMRSVPNLLNYTQAEALAAIDESDFFAQGKVSEEYSSTVEDGRVISQTPVAGKKAERDTKIDLVISKGEEPKMQVEVPDLHNMTPSEAQAELAKVHLKGENRDSVYDENVEAGRVAAQSPDAGEKATEGDVVTYHLSKGIESVEVPSVVGDSESYAISVLQEKGFKVDVDYDSSSAYDSGIVMEQSKTGAAEKGSTIRIIVSTGKPKVDIPDVTNYDQASAVSTLEALGLSVSVETQASPVAAGIVIDQSLFGSYSADEAKSITIVVSSGPEQHDDNGGDNGGSNDNGGDNGSSDDNGGDNGGSNDNGGSEGSDTGNDSGNTDAGETTHTDDTQSAEADTTHQ